MATNLFRKTQSLYASTANTFSTGDSETITPASVSGLPTDTEMTLTFDRVDSSGTETPTKMERIIGVVTGGNFVSRVTTGRGADGSTEQAHTSPVVEYIPNAKDMDDAVDGILVEHTQAGLHKNIATASDVATATNNTKIVTPLAVAPYANNSLNRQAIINGNFDIWQRGTTVSPTPAINPNGFLADRWLAQAYSGSGGSPGNQTITISQQAFTPGQTDVPNEPTYYKRLTVTTVGDQGTDGNSFFRFYYKAEGVRMFAGQTATLSFYAKADSSRDMAVCLRQDFGSGGSAAVDSGGGETKSLTTSWQKFTTTFTMPSISGKTIGTSSYLDLSLMLYKEGNTAYLTPDGEVGTWSAGVFDLAQVQLCAGSVALPFQPKSYAQELADCQRYYFNSRDGAVQKPSSFGIGATTATIATNAHFPVSMRAVPTIVIYSYNNTASKVADFGGTTDRGTTVTAGVSNVTRSSFSKINDSGTSFTTANLYWFYFTADAEL